MRQNYLGGKMGGGSDVAIQLKTKQRGAQTTADGSTLLLHTERQHRTPA